MAHFLTGEWENISPSYTLKVEPSEKFDLSDKFKESSSHLVSFSASSK